MNAFTTNPRLVRSCLLTVSAFLLANTLSATAITNWQRDTGSAATSNLTTASPVIGTGAEKSANGTLLSSSIAPVTLQNIGDVLTFSGAVTFEGLGGTLQYGFRWGVFNTNGSSNVNGWLGYYAENGSNTASDGIKPSRLWERNADNTGAWWSSGSATQRTGVNPSNNAYLVNGSYSLTMRYELTAVNTLTVSWSLVGEGDAASHSVTGSYVDTTPGTLTFDRVGIGNAQFDASRISFSDLDISYTAIPEPAAAWLTGLLALAAGIGVSRRLRR